ncbi:MAG: hypothetical protein JXM70_30485, partial [Pirellulales bacterium]|nr:hypothetical protein [Pirellulales bacterium]
PYELRQPGNITVIDTLDKHRRLIVRPQSPIAKRGRLTVVSPLTSEPVAVPRITPVGSGKHSQILVLPNRNGSESIAWETRGLTKTSLPDKYEVADSRFRAVLISSNTGQGNADVNLADINISWEDDGTAGGTAAFDLLPDGRSWCPLWVPDNYQLIEIRLDDMLTVPVANDEPPTKAGDATAEKSRWRKYRIQLSSRTLPQRIEVVFRGRLATAQWRQQSPGNAPRLGNLPVAKTLWCVRGPRQYAPIRPATSADCLRHEIMRLQNTIAIIEQGIALPNRKADEFLNWYRPWNRRYMAAEYDVRLAAAAVDELDLTSQANDLLKQIDSRRREIAKELQAENIPAPQEVQTPPAVDANALWSTTLVASRPVAMLIEDTQAAEEATAAAQGDLSFRPVRTSDLWTRFYAILAIVAVIGIAQRGFHGELLATLARRWPHLLGVVAGLLWWLFLNPSLLGLIIVAVCLIASVRPGWQDEPHGDSMIVPLS